jgi:hypothetical protein
MGPGSARRGKRRQSRRGSLLYGSRRNVLSNEVRLPVIFNNHIPLIGYSEFNQKQN